MTVALRRKLYVAGLLIVMFLVSGCYGGRTTRFVVPLDKTDALDSLRPIKVASLEREEEGMRLINVGVKPWGKFDDNDQANIRASLEDSLAAALQNRVAGNTETIKVYVVIRKYIVGVSNNAAAVWAGIDWCAADADNLVLFQETFYATSTGRLVVTTGGVKDDVNLAIVKRIAQSSVHMAANTQPTTLEIPDTYSTFEEAAATMPETLQSWGAPFFVGTIFIGVYGVTAPERFPLEFLAIKEPIDWQKRLTETR